MESNDDRLERFVVFFMSLKVEGENEMDIHVSQKHQSLSYLCFVGKTVRQLNVLISFSQALLVYKMLSWIFKFQCPLDELN